MNTGAILTKAVDLSRIMLSFAELKDVHPTFPASDFVDRTLVAFRPPNQGTSPFATDLDRVMDKDSVPAEHKDAIEKAWNQVQAKPCFSLAALSLNLYPMEFLELFSERSERIATSQMILGETKEEDEKSVAYCQFSTSTNNTVKLTSRYVLKVGEKPLATVCETYILDEENSAFRPQGCTLSDNSQAALETLAFALENSAVFPYYLRCKVTREITTDAQEQALLARMQRIASVRNSLLKKKSQREEADEKAGTSKTTEAQLNQSLVQFLDLSLLSLSEDQINIIPNLTLSQLLSILERVAGLHLTRIGQAAGGLTSPASSPAKTLAALTSAEGAPAQGATLSIAFDRLYVKQKEAYEQLEEQAVWTALNLSDELKTKAMQAARQQLCDTLTTALSLIQQHDPSSEVERENTKAAIKALAQPIERTVVLAVLSSAEPSQLSSKQFDTMASVLDDDTSREHQLCQATKRLWENAPSDEQKSTLQKKLAILLASPKPLSEALDAVAKLILFSSSVLVALNEQLALSQRQSYLEIKRNQWEAEITTRKIKLPTLLLQALSAPEELLANYENYQLQIAEKLNTDFMSSRGYIQATDYFKDNTIDYEHYLKKAQKEQPKPTQDFEQTQNYIYKHTVLLLGHGKQLTESSLRLHNRVAAHKLAVFDKHGKHRSLFVCLILRAFDWLRHHLVGKQSKAHRQAHSKLTANKATYDNSNHLITAEELLSDKHNLSLPSTAAVHAVEVDNIVQRRLVAPVR